MVDPISEAPTADVSTNLRKHPGFQSQFLSDPRNLVVYLPPGYKRDTSRRYPVLYLHVGQNLFEGATAFVPGQDWHVNETAESLITAGAIEPLIIVGIYNTRKQRIYE